MELMEEVLRGWLGEQEDQIEDLKEHLAQKQKELVRLTQVEEEEEVAGLQLHDFLPEEQLAATKQEALSQVVQEREALETRLKEVQQEGETSTELLQLEAEISPSRGS